MRHSRIGKLPVEIPAKVNVAVAGDLVSVEGPKGKLSQKLPHGISVEVADGKLTVKRDESVENVNALYGLTRALIQNMVTGVHEGFTKRLEIVGIGYRAQAKGNGLTLSLGFSHPVEYALPKGVEAKVEQNTKLTLTCADKQLLGRVAAEIRGFRPPEPYKGKGVKYADEHIRRKAGKAASK